jgi:hypothetical protein
MSYLPYNVSQMGWVRRARDIIEAVMLRLIRPRAQMVDAHRLVAYVFIPPFALPTSLLKRNHPSLFLSLPPPLPQRLAAAMS